MSNTDFDDLRDFGDDFEDFGDPEEDEAFAVEEAAARRGRGMTPVEQIILAVFVLLNVLALLVIILIITGVWRL